jgi:hypothetical protein
MIGDIKAVLFRLVIFLLEALNTDGIVLKILYKERNVPLDINHIGRSLLDVIYLYDWSLSVRSESHYDGYFTIFCVSYGMGSTYMIGRCLYVRNLTMMDILRSFAFPMGWDLPINTDGIVLKILYKERNVPLDINHIGRSHPIGETKDGKISIIVRFRTYRQRPIT